MYVTSNIMNVTSNLMYFTCTIDRMYVINYIITSVRYHNMMYVTSNIVYITIT